MERYIFLCTIGVLYYNIHDSTMAVLNTTTTYMTLNDYM